MEAGLCAYVSHSPVLAIGIHTSIVSALAATTATLVLTTAKATGHIEIAKVSSPGRWSLTWLLILWNPRLIFLRCLRFRHCRRSVRRERGNIFLSGVRMHSMLSKECWEAQALASISICVRKMSQRFTLNSKVFTRLSVLRV